MLLRFELNFPQNNSWNGQSNDQKRQYVFRTVKDEKAKEIVNKSFSYNFGDGWRAHIEVTKNNRTKSNGFRGYEWMVDEIIKYGRIRTLEERGK